VVEEQEEEEVEEEVANVHCHTKETGSKMWVAGPAARVGGVHGGGLDAEC